MQTVEHDTLQNWAAFARHDCGVRDEFTDPPGRCPSLIARSPSSGSDHTLVAHSNWIGSALAVVARWPDHRETFDEWDLDSWSEPFESSRAVGQLVRFPKRSPAESAVRELRRQFGELVEQWTTQTMLSSSSTVICMHPAYQRVIGLGEQVLPLIFEDMMDGEFHWSWALTAITGENPASDAESLQAATNMWLQWGRDKGLVT